MRFGMCFSALCVAIACLVCVPVAVGQPTVVDIDSLTRECGGNPAKLSADQRTAISPLATEYNNMYLEFSTVVGGLLKQMNEANNAGLIATRESRHDDARRFWAKASEFSAAIDAETDPASALRNGIQHVVNKVKAILAWKDGKDPNAKPKRAESFTPAQRTVLNNRFQATKDFPNRDVAELEESIFAARDQCKDALAMFDIASKHPECRAKLNNAFMKRYKSNKPEVVAEIRAGLQKNLDFMNKVVKAPDKYLLNWDNPKEVEDLFWESYSAADKEELKKKGLRVKPADQAGINERKSIAGQYGKDAKTPTATALDFGPPIGERIIIGSRNWGRKDLTPEEQAAVKNHEAYHIVANATDIGRKAYWYERGDEKRVYYDEKELAAMTTEQALPHAATYELFLLDVEKLYKECQKK